MSDTEAIGAVRALLETLATTAGPTGGEGPRTNALAAWLADAGLPTRRDDADNLWVDLPTDGAWNECVVLDAHLDVVGRGVADRLVERDGKLIGAGVADDLAAAALMAVFARRCLDEGKSFARPLKIVFTVGEEGVGNLRGVRQIADDHETGPALYLAFDGSHQKCHVAGLGSNRYRLEVGCPGGHSWGAYGAPSATEILVDLLNAIRKAHRRLADKHESTLSFNIGELAGGEGINCLAREAAATFEFRCADAAVLARMDRLTQKIVAAAARERVSLECRSIGRRPAAAPYGNATAETLLRRIWTEHGLPLATTIASTNINIPLSRGWPAVCVGLIAGGNGHREDEYVVLDSLATGWSLLETIAARLDEL